jgi:hypothetical protein
LHHSLHAHCQSRKTAALARKCLRNAKKLRERARVCVLHMSIVPCEFSSRQHAERNNNHYCYCSKHTNTCTHTQAILFVGNPQNTGRRTRRARFHSAPVQLLFCSHIFMYVHCRAEYTLLVAVCRRVNNCMQRSPLERRARSIIAVSTFFITL